MMTIGCMYCDEELLPTEDTVLSGNGQPFHRECFVRAIFGSAAHQLGECRCYGGTRDDPPDMTLRQGAVVAYEVFSVQQGAKL